MAYRYMGLQVWQALLCLALGFFLAATTAAPEIRARDQRPRLGGSAAFHARDHIEGSDAHDRQTPVTPSASDLQKVAASNRTASHLTDEVAPPGPSRHLAITSPPRSPTRQPSSAEITRLRAELADARLDRANLAAAALATIAAHADGEPDPLSYLRDELRAQGYDPSRGRR